MLIISIILNVILYLKYRERKIKLQEFYKAIRDARILGKGLAEKFYPEIMGTLYGLCVKCTNDERGL